MSSRRKTWVSFWQTLAIQYKKKRFAFITKGLELLAYKSDLVKEPI